MLGVIYKYTSPSGKIYIGQTINEKSRRNDWFKNTYKYAGIAINNARYKYGRNSFKYDVIFKYDFINLQICKKSLNHIEYYFIKYYKSSDKRFGYNIETGSRDSDEWSNKRKSLPESHIVSCKSKIGILNSFYGKKHSEDTIYKIKKSQGKPVIQFDLKTNKIIAEYVCLTDASIAITGKKSSSSCISRVCNGIFNQYKGYGFKFKN